MSILSVAPLPLGSAVSCRRDFIAFCDGGGDAVKKGTTYRECDEGEGDGSVESHPSTK